MTQRYRIAVSGSHDTGKTTMIGELIGSLSTFNTVDEPYYLLEEEGHAFSAIPCLEDYVLQLERSIESIAESEGDVLFDRCPFDILAYLLTHDESEAFDVNRWLPKVRDAIQQLDLVVFVPIEDPDRVTVDGTELRHLRRREDDELQSLVLADLWSFGVPVIEVTGSPGERARQVLTYLEGEAGLR